MDIKLCGKNWHGRDYGPILVRKVSLPPIWENRSCLGGVL